MHTGEIRLGRCSMRLSLRDWISILGFVSLGISLLTVSTPFASTRTADTTVPQVPLSSDGMSGGMKPPAELKLNMDGRDIVTIYASGDVRLAEGLTPTEASREFWRKVGELAPNFCRAQLSKPAQ
jgi:hypothetical protein